VPNSNRSGIFGSVASGGSCCGACFGEGITGGTGIVISGGITGIGFGDAVAVGNCCAAHLDHTAITSAGGCWRGGSLGFGGMGIALGG
jgi:hypothetical protein